MWCCGSTCILVCATRWVCYTLEEAFQLGYWKKSKGHPLVFLIFAGSRLNRPGPLISLFSPVCPTASLLVSGLLCTLCPVCHSSKELSLYAGEGLGLLVFPCVYYHASGIYVLMSTILEVLSCPSDSEVLLCRSGQ